MAEAIQATNDIVDIKKEDLLLTAMKMKHEGRRLVQTQCSWINNLFECLYTFSDDETYDITNFKVTVSEDEEIPSITSIYPYANFYESEMTELYGVKIQMIDKDYHNKLYRIKAVHPFGPQEEKK